MTRRSRVAHEICFYCLLKIAKRPKFSDFSGNNFFFGIFEVDFKWDTASEVQHPDWRSWSSWFTYFGLTKTQRNEHWYSTEPRKRNSWNSCRSWHNWTGEGVSQQSYSIFKINHWKKETEKRTKERKREKKGKKERKRGRNYVVFRTTESTATQWAVGARSANDVRTAVWKKNSLRKPKPNCRPWIKTRSRNFHDVILFGSHFLT